MTHPLISTPNKGFTSIPISVNTEYGKYGTTVNLLWNGSFPDYMTNTLNDPPRIVVDIFSAAQSFESVTIPVKCPNLKSLRVGYHPKKIRMVLDIKGALIPNFSTESADNGLTLFLRSGETMENQGGQPKVSNPETNLPEADQGNSFGNREQNHVSERKPTQMVAYDGKDSIQTQRALIQKTKIFHQKKKRKEALSILKDSVSKYPGSPELTEAKKKMSKILYEMNSFRKSLNILSELRKTDPHNIYKYPEISLYMGYNYYQLGDNVRARENLLRFYNICPDREINHFILTQIGDTYRNEGLKKDAKVFYQLVLERYPHSEGAVISKIRLAEQQKKGEIASFIKIKDKDVGSPKEIYEDIINKPLDKDKKKTMTQLTMLKLAILHQKEKNYDKSLKILKDLLTKNPRLSLRKECKHALLKTIGALLKQELKWKRYTNVVNIYQREKVLSLMPNDPELFLTLARAYLNLNLQDTATEMFKRSDSLFLEKEKPPDLIFFLSQDLFKKEKLKSALARLDFLINNYPSDKYAPNAYQLKGRILFKQMRFPQAVEMFSSALKLNLKPCKRAEILIDKAKALIEQNLNDNALIATKKTDSLKGDCHVRSQHIHKEIGDLYLHLGCPKEALSVFNQALNIEKDDENKILLTLKVAQCYRLLDKKEDCLALYDQIASLNDPFWSNLAKERIDEIKFSREIFDWVIEKNK